jgi:prolyl-tRNA synthetase
MAGGGGAVQGRHPEPETGRRGCRCGCAKLYRELEAKGVEVLYDDTDQRAGAKFAAADLIGIPWQILVGPKGLAEGKLELKRAATGHARI